MRSTIWSECSRSQFRIKSRWCSAAHSNTMEAARFGNGPVEHVDRVDPNLRFILSVERMKMRRLVVVEVHPNDDAKEPADLRHICPDASTCVCHGRPSSVSALAARYPQRMFDEAQYIQTIKSLLLALLGTQEQIGALRVVLYESGAATHEQFETILERVQLVNEERRKQIEKIGVQDLDSVLSSFEGMIQ